MCGRYANSQSAARLSELFEAVDDTGGALAPDYNVAPTDPAPVVRVSRSAAARVVQVARWGLLPTWAKDARGAARMINARAETVATSKAFAPSFARRRCLVPVDGWYEWSRLDSGARQAYFITGSAGTGSAGTDSAGPGSAGTGSGGTELGGSGVLGLAGLWSSWGTGDQRRLTFSVVTVPAVGQLREIHDRMPLILAPSCWSDWLEAGDGDPPEHLLAPPSVDQLDTLELRPVGSAVGDVRNDGPHLTDRVTSGSAQRLADDAGNFMLF